MPAVWRLESREMDGTYLAPIKFRNLQGEFYMNRKQIRFEIPLSSSRLNYTTFFPRKHEIWGYRNDELVFAGPLWDVTASSKENKLSCYAAGIESYFDTRLASVVDRAYSNTLGNICWQLINSTQALTNGNVLVTRGLAVPGYAPSMTWKYSWKELATLTDVHNELADSDIGFDWEITPQRVYNQYWPRIMSNSNTRLEYGGNVTSFSLQAMGKYEANTVIVKGAEGIVSSWAIDTTKRSEFGLSHYSASETSIKSQALLNAHAAMLLKLRRDARMVPSLTMRSDVINPFAGDIKYGQIAPVVIDHYWAQVNQPMRLMGFQITVGKQGNETFNLYLSDMREVAGS